MYVPNLSKETHTHVCMHICMYLLVPGRVENSSGSGSGFGKSSGSGLIGFAFSSKVRVRVYRVSFLKFGFSGLSGSGLNCELEIAKMHLI